jgi:hypothetical protein
MASITRPLSWFDWFYNEFGLASIQATGRNAYLIIVARTMRMVSFGGTQVMLGMLGVSPDIDFVLTWSYQLYSLPS